MKRRSFTFILLLSLVFAVVLPLFYRNFTEEASAEPVCSADGVPVLALMYHQFKKVGTSDYIVTPDLFRQDLQLLKSRGYTSVTANQIIGYVRGKAALPQKPVLITFDDGHYNQMYYAYPILKEEGFTAVASVIGQFSHNTVASGDVSNPNYSHLTWDEIKELSDSGVFEIGNHTYNMHGYRPRFGISQLPGERPEDYLKTLTDDVQKLQTVLTEKSGVTPNVFAIPFGKYSQSALTRLSELGFQMIFTCNEGVTRFSPGDKDAMLRVKRYNRSPKRDLSALLDKTDALF